MLGRRLGVHRSGGNRRRQQERGRDEMTVQYRNKSVMRRIYDEMVSGHA